MQTLEGGVAVADAAPPPAISVVVPAFNEARSIPELLAALVPILSRHGTFEILVVDDGSRDDTLEVLRRHRATDPRVGYLSLARNFGHQCALRAGLAHARGECVISMDADLQHPPELIDVLVGHWRSGYDVVFTKRQDGATVPFFKRLTSRIFYKVINSLADIEIEEGAADFRLISRRVLDVLNSLEEQPFFLRGLLPWMGFRQIGVDYVPQDRRHGQSKYTLRKMLRLATDGVTSFTTHPLVLSLGLGALTAAAALAYSAYVLYMHAFTGRTVPGWTSVVLAVLWLGSMQLIVLGIIGQYLGKIFMASKKRPPYLVMEAAQGERRRGGGDGR